MRYVFASYVYTKEFNQPQAWLTRINMYTGILDALAKSNKVISIEQINYEGELTQNGVNYHFRRYPKAALKYFPWALHWYIKSLKPDVVIVHGLLFPLQVIQLRLMLGRKVKIIVQNHAEKPFTGLKKLLQRAADRLVNANLFASHDMGMEWIAAGNLKSPGKIHEIMEVSSVFYPISRQEANSQTGAQGNPVFLWVGRLNENKDPLNVVRAFLKFAESSPGAKLFMIYHTEELLPKINELLNWSPNKEAVELIGEVPHADLLYWYNSADFILSGSHYEGSGTAICEAMSCGCVPLVTDIFSFRMITNNGECGVLYEPGNEAALLDVLLQTTQMNVADKRRLSIEYYKRNLSFEAIAERIESIVQNL